MNEWSDVDTANHVCALYFCDNNIALKMAVVAAETCW